jgi:hypothetical protein
MMNSRIGLSPDGKSVLATPFCAVCQYIMIDWLDPLLHSEIDQHYDRIYPVFGQGGTP